MALCVALSLPPQVSSVGDDTLADGVGMPIGPTVVTHYRFASDGSTLLHLASLHGEARK